MATWSAREVRHTLRGHTDWVHAAHARWKRHPTDDTYDVVVLSASDDGTLRTWDVKRAAMIKCAPSPTPDDLVPHHVKLSDVVAAEDAASNAANVDATRDQSRSSCVVEWGEPESCPLTLRVGGEKGRELHVHDASGVRITTLLGHTARIECCELNTASHLGKVRVACGGRDGMLNVWDIDGSAIEDGGGHHHEPMACFSHASTVRTLCLGNAGQSVVTGCSDGSLSHFDLANCDRIGHHGRKRQAPELRKQVRETCSCLASHRQTKMTVSGKLRAMKANRCQKGKRLRRFLPI